MHLGDLLFPVETLGGLYRPEYLGHAEHGARAVAPALRPASAAILR